MKVPGKVAIVTGASFGIGESTARLLSKRGAKVALVARSQEKLEKLSQELPDSLVIVADMTKEADIKAIVKKVDSHFGGIDILVNNAGRGYDAKVADIEAGLFEELFQLDLLAPALIMKEVIPHMKKRQCGAIVNISSGTARMAIPGMSPYSSLKRAIVGLSLTAREELKEDGIAVSVVYPYITKTAFEKNTIKTKETGHWEDREIPEGDTPEFVAEKILEAITSGAPEIFAHEWMKRMGK